MGRFLSIGAIALLCASTSVHSADLGQNPELGVLCGKRDDIAKALSDQFKEKLQAIGVVDKKAIVEIFVSPDSTWTILATGTDGVSCLVSSGEGWQSITIIAGTDS